MTRVIGRSESPRGRPQLTPDVVRAGAEVLRFAEIGREFVTMLPAGRGAWQAEPAKSTALRLANALGTALGTAHAWATILVLEAPAARRHLRVVLLRELTGRGVYRDLSDLPDVGSCAIGALLAAALLSMPNESQTILDFIAARRDEESARAVSTADGTLLGFLLRPEKIRAMINLSDWQGPLGDALELAAWIAAVDGGESAPPPPESVLTRTWFETRAYRGPRRRWARKRGLDAGAAGSTTLEAWLSWQGEELPEGYGSLVVEWTLAVILGWPDREKRVREEESEIARRAEALVGQAEAVLRRCAGRSELTSWLLDGSRRLTDTPEHDRRLPTRRRQVEASEPFRK